MAQQQQSATHWRKVHKRKNEHLLFAEDLGGFGAKPRDVEIVDSGVIKVEGAENDSKDMPWIAFRGAKKRLALNATNCKTLQSICGTGTIEQWRGWITLIVVRTTYYDRLTKKTEDTDAIRIAPRRPKGKGDSKPIVDDGERVEPERDASPASEPDADEIAEIAARDAEGA